MLDLPFNLSLLVVEVIALAWVARARTPSSVARAASVALIASGLLALLWAQTGFHFLRLLCWALFVHAPVDLFVAGVLLARAPSGSDAGPAEAGPVGEGAPPEGAPDERSAGPSGGTARARRWTAAGCLALAASLVVVAVDAFLIEPQWLEVTRLEVSAPGLERPLRLVLVADLQTDRVGAYERSVLERVRELKADLVLFAGDYLQCGPGDDEPSEAQALREILRELGPLGRLGTYAVGGDCEGEGWEALFADVGVRPLGREQRVAVHEQLEVLGVTLGESRSTPRLRARGGGRFRVLLGHAPDMALADPDVDLILAGHVHGGQVRLPGIGPLITLSGVPRDWAVGRTELAPGKTLIVSRGVGLERKRAPRLRFLCRPELVVVDLVPGRMADGKGRSGG